MQLRCGIVMPRWPSPPSSFPLPIPLSSFEAVCCFLEYSVVSLVAIWCVLPGGNEDEGRSGGSRLSPPNLCLHLCDVENQPPHWTPLYPIPGSKYVGGHMGSYCEREKAMRMGRRQELFGGVTPSPFRQDAIWGKDRSRKETHPLQSRSSMVPDGTGEGAAVSLPVSTA